MKMAVLNFANIVNYIIYTMTNICYDNIYHDKHMLQPIYATTNLYYIKMKNAKNK